MGQVVDCYVPVSRGNHQVVAVDVHLDDGRE